MKKLKSLLKALSVILVSIPVSTEAASLLPWGQQQFTDSNGAPLAGGQVCLYVPGTTTPKLTWQDRAQSVANTSPCVTLNSAGRAILWGYGQYRQMVYDSQGNLLWDQVVSEYVSDVQNNAFNWGGTAGGTANALTIAVSPAPPALVAGQAFEFTVGVTNTGAATLDVNGLGVKSITKASSSGPVALTGGELVVGSVAAVEYDGSQFQIVGGNGASACSSTVQGLVPATGGGTTNFLRADCTFAAPLTVPNSPLLGGNGTALVGVTATAPLAVSAGALSAAQFAAGASGIVPASGGGTTNFLRADGTWAAPTASAGQQSQVFTSVGTSTFTIPAANLKVTLVGGGSGQSPSPGGTGGVCKVWLTGLTVGDTLTVVVGAGAASWPANGNSTTLSSGTQTITTSIAGGGQSDGSNATNSNCTLNALLPGWLYGASDTHQYGGAEVGSGDNGIAVIEW